MTLAASDFDTFFDPSDFGTPAVMTTAGDGQSHDLVGIFSAPGSVVLQGDHAGVSTELPVFTIAEITLPAAHARGDRIVLAAVAYVAMDFQPDGTGLMRLVLEKE